MVKKCNLAARCSVLSPPSPSPIGEENRTRRAARGGATTSRVSASSARPPHSDGGGGTPTLFTPESLRREEVREGRKEEPLIRERERGSVDKSREWSGESWSSVPLNISRILCSHL